jgi:hypothetical protein
VVARAAPGFHQRSAHQLMKSVRDAQTRVAFD